MLTCARGAARRSNGRVPTQRAPAREKVHERERGKERETEIDRAREREKERETEIDSEEGGERPRRLS